jgi:hypothetical protein
MRRGSKIKRFFGSSSTRPPDSFPFQLQNAAQSLWMILSALRIDMVGGFL